MSARAKELEDKRRALVSYSDAQRRVMSECLATLKRPLRQGDRLIGTIKANPLAGVLGLGSVLMAGWAAKKVARFSLGFWLGKQVFRFARGRTPPR